MARWRERDEMKKSTKGLLCRWHLLVGAGVFLLAMAALPQCALAYDLHAIHPDRLACPKGTTLARVETNPRQCRPEAKRGIPATRDRRACCTLDRDRGKQLCLSFVRCPRASAE